MELERKIVELFESLLDLKVYGRLNVTVEEGENKAVVKIEMPQKLYKLPTDYVK